MIELACLAIVLAYVVPRARPRFFGEYALLATLAWVAEDTCIRLYGFYAYAPTWHVFLDQVPLLVVLIWPSVILSARDLARALSPRRVPLAGALIVFADAWLIEPVAVSAGLWWWTVPGLFEVPPIGVLGWSIFAGLALAALEPRRPALAAVAVIAVPAGTHALLLTAWWGAFRWISGPVPTGPAVALAWIVSLVLARRALRRPGPVPRGELLSRAPGAVFFFVLAATRATGALLAWVPAFSLPYLTLLAAGRAGASEAHASIRERSRAGTGSEA